MSTTTRKPRSPKVLHFHLIGLCKRCAKRFAEHRVPAGHDTQEGGCELCGKWKELTQYAIDLRKYLDDRITKLGEVLERRREAKAKGAACTRHPQPRKQPKA